jgi:hypothetical protein
MKATGGVAQGSWRKPERKAEEGLPYLKILAVIQVLILPGLAWLTLNGY